METKEFVIERCVTRLDFDIPVKIYGAEISGPERVVIAVHGFAGDKESSVIKALGRRISENNGCVVCFDFPAHGKSEALDSDLTVKNCISSLCAVAEFVKNKYPDTNEFGIFATSFGGYISILSSFRLRSILGDAKYVLRAPAVRMSESLLDKIVCLSETEFEEKGSFIFGFERKFDVSFDFYKDLKENDVFEKEFSENFIVIHGDQDDIVLPEHIKSFVDKFNAGRLFVIKGADHRFKNSGELEKIIEFSAGFLCC